MMLLTTRMSSTAAINRVAAIRTSRMLAPGYL
jgi:hypothetical protein